MKRVYVSQGVDIVARYGERRDALDQRWIPFLKGTGVALLPLPNNTELVSDMLKESPPDGILLTGGNSPVKYGGNAPERDAADTLLLDYAVEHKIPLIGVCRGMQSIVLYFGGRLRETGSHAAVRHEVSGRINREVNSYHTLAIDTIPQSLEVLARSEDNFTESVRHKILPVLGIMWHPEREEDFSGDDLDMFSNIWRGKAGVI